MSPLAFLLLSLTLALPPGEWIVTRAERASWRDAVTGTSLTIVGTFGPDQRYALVRGSERWRVPPAIIAAQPNFRYSAAGDPDLVKSWALENEGQPLPSGLVGTAGSDIGAREAWDLYPTGTPTLVAILDSGIDIDHEELRRRLWRNPGETANGVDDDGNGLVDDIHGWDFVNGVADVRDGNGHGTFCAGIIGAEGDNGKGTRGVHPEAELMAARMLDANGFGTTASAIRAIQYAVENGAAVINASWGGANFDQALYDSVKWAGERGVLFVTAAGNDRKNNDTDPRPTYPASFKLPNIISVAAYDARDALASFSNFGKETVHVGAPGVEIYGTKPGGYRYGEGTSFAAPYVSGVAALVRSVAPGLTLQEWRSRLLLTSEPLHYYQKEKTSSAGRIHAANAVRDYRPQRPATPTNWTRFPLHEETAHPYENKASQEIRIRHPGARHVRAHFKAFDTEGCCDGVALRDSSSTRIIDYRGNLGDFWSADAIGDELIIHFTSDFSMAQYGFEIDAYEVSY